MSSNTLADNLKKQRENRSRQLNKNNILYWKARGIKIRPENWKIDE